MRKYILLIVIIVALIYSCSPAAKFRKDKVAFDASPITHSFKSVADMNDAYFEIRENGFFDFYRQLFDSVKNTRYPGRYHITNDTMYLKFYDKRGAELLGTRAVVNEKRDDITFLK